MTMTDERSEQIERTRRAGSVRAPAVPADDPILGALHEKAAELDATKIMVEKLSREIDRMVVDARLAGYRYRDLAVAAGRSVAWVQASLVRSETAAARD